jgi:glycosyltransferase involved in cell wall biosynthesis
MSKVLLIARHFPPIGGAGVHRTVGSVRHLPEHGYEPLVVTGRPQHIDRWEPRDEDLLQRIPATVPVHRLDEPGPTGGGSRLARVLGLPPPWVRHWVDAATRLGVEAGRDADVVIASCVPYETALAGSRVARALKVPWIADLEDPWALDEMRLHPTALHHAADLRRMRRALASAAAIVMAAPEAARRVRDAMPELSDRIVCSIPIGFEPDDFLVPAAPRSDAGVLRIVHTGSMHTDFGLHLRATRRRRRLLGGTVDGLDILPRSHVFLVEAIEQLLAADPALRDRIELHLAGELTAGDRDVAQRHAFVRTPGLLPHAETVALMRSADLLFLPMHDLPVGTRAGLIPYKTFEYLAAERPILAAVPDGDVRDLLADIEHADVVQPTDVEAMTAVLRAAVARGPVGPVRDGIDSPALAALDRRESVAQIAAVLGRVRARPVPIPA